MFDKRSMSIREFAFKHVDHFVAITDICKKTLELEGIESNRITRIYPGIDLGVFKPTSSATRKSEKFHILFVGKLTSWKGCYTLLYAAKILLPRIPNLHITFVGRGAQRKGLEEASSLLGISNRITFTVFIDYEKMPSFYSDADVFVLPAMPAINFAEQFGFVVAESMACGLPTLVSRVGGLPEVVGENQKLIFTPGDYRELASKLLEIHDDQQLRAELSTWCHHISSTRYDSTKNGAKLQSCLQDLLTT